MREGESVFLFCVFSLLLLAFVSIEFKAPYASSCIRFISMVLLTK